MEILRLSLYRLNGFRVPPVGNLRSTNFIDVCTIFLTTVSTLHLIHHNVLLYIFHSSSFTAFSYLQTFTLLLIRLFQPTVSDCSLFLSLSIYTCISPSLICHILSSRLVASLSFFYLSIMVCVPPLIQSFESILAFCIHVSSSATYILPLYPLIFSSYINPPCFLLYTILTILISGVTRPGEVQQDGEEGRWSHDLGGVSEDEGVATTSLHQ